MLRPLPRKIEPHLRLRGAQPIGQEGDRSARPRTRWARRSFGHATTRNRRPTADRDPPGMPLHRCASFVACLMARVASNRWRIFLQAELSAPSPGLTEIGRTRESTFGLASALRCRLVSAPTHVEVDGARRRDRRYDYSSLSFVRRVVVGSRSRGSLDRCGYRGGT
jgi:hypothetical protein